MNILLVWPHIRKKLSLAIFTYPLFTLQQVAGTTPKKHTVTIVDERYQTLKFDKKYDVVGISCLTYLAARAYKIADEFRKRGSIVVIGGDHASVMPEEAKQYADAVVVGEAEASWSRLLEDIENGELKPYYKQTKAVDAQSIPPANREAGSNRPIVAALEASRGCPVGCEFCAVSHRVGGNVLRMRPVSDVIDEIKSIKNKFLFFFSPSMTANPAYSKSLFKEMIGLNKRFTCYGNANVLGRDEELLQVASEAGCHYWLVGFESISQDTINSIGKKTNKVQDYERTVQKIHQYNMKILGNFVFGFDGDTPAVFDDTLRLAERIKLDLAQFSVLTPFPGTPLFHRLEKEGRILTKDWSKYTEADVVFEPKHMTAEELVQGGMKCYREFYSMPNILKRVITNKNINLLFFFNTWKLKYLDYKIYYKMKGLKQREYHTMYQKHYKR